MSNSVEQTRPQTWYESIAFNDFNEMFDSRLPENIDVLRDPKTVLVVLEEIEQTSPEYLEKITIRCVTDIEEHVTGYYDPDDRNASFAGGMVSEVDDVYEYHDVSLAAILHIARNVKRDDIELPAMCLLTASWGRESSPSPRVFGSMSPALEDAAKILQANRASIEQVLGK